jgi:hypothetical protein
MNPEIQIQQARRNLIRWRILGALYQDRLSPALDELIVGVMQAKIIATLTEVRAELAYLEQRKLVAVTRSTDHWTVALTWIGIDLVEYTIPCEPGIARPAADAEPNRKQIVTGMLRGRILHVMGIGGGGTMHESLLLTCIGGPDFPVSQNQLRLELHYLGLRGLITLPVDKQDQDWACQMTREGTDVSQGTVACFAGITLRPGCNAGV